MLISAVIDQAFVSSVPTRLSDIGFGGGPQSALPAAAAAFMVMRDSRSLHSTSS